MNYKWNKTDYPKPFDLKVFSTFACGGGSTMGYKMAGFKVIGANDIDPQMKKVYEKNHNPDYFFLCGIDKLLDTELPRPFYDLDILDGSPPCSTFSIAGLREKAWKKKKKFREGQAEQILSDLFFQYIALAEKLQPKIVVAENVKGMLLGNARSYTKAVIKGFEQAGYDTQLFLLNSATMGLPQKRERVFFIGRRKDLKLPELKLSFNEKPVLFSEIDQGNVKSEYKIADCYSELWDKCAPGKALSSVHHKGSYFNAIKLSRIKVPNTIASGSTILHPSIKRHLTVKELSLIGSFPQDYDYLDVDPKYLIGMSVPPLMMFKIAEQIRKQLLK